MNFLIYSMLAGCGLFATARPVGTWDILDFWLECPDANSCNYSFFIAEQVDTTNDIPQKYCRFLITAASGQPAYNTSFIEKTCPGLLQYRIDGSWDDHGSITIVVTDIEQEQITASSYSRAPIKEDRTTGVRANTSYKMVAISQRSAGAVAPIAQHTQSQDKHAESWSIEGLFRRAYLTHVYVDFYIHTPELSVHCSIHLQGVSGVNTKTMSWYDQKCEDMPWAISWGYNPVKDSAVMTVQNPLGTKRAFFGWDNVNAAMDLPNAGPNPVEHL